MQGQKYLEYGLCKIERSLMASMTIAKPKYSTTSQEPTEELTLSHAKKQNADLKR